MSQQAKGRQVQRLWHDLAAFGQSCTKQWNKWSWEMMNIWLLFAAALGRVLTPVTVVIGFCVKCSFSSLILITLNKTSLLYIHADLAFTFKATPDFAHFPE